jgi:hypothetical protein
MVTVGSALKVAVRATIGAGCQAVGAIPIDRTKPLKWLGHYLVGGGQTFRVPDKFLAKAVASYCTGTEALEVLLDMMNDDEWITITGPLYLMVGTFQFRFRGDKVYLWDRYDWHKKDGYTGDYWQSVGAGEVWNLVFGKGPMFGSYKMSYLQAEIVVQSNRVISWIGKYIKVLGQDPNSVSGGGIPDRFWKVLGGKEFVTVGKCTLDQIRRYLK